ncbi:lipoprotein 17-related variable surface protein [Metamycoplasma buccale]|uniref:lipoprotein 17-related variable surface protein n=1 Tax=Metamycoplasma buccale TaxID=55602 RepID=UPI00398F7DCC
MKKRIWLTSLVALSTITPTAFLVTSCNNELTKEQVEKGTEISVENVGNLKPNEVTKDNVKVTKQPKDWEVTVKDLKINNDTVEVTLEAKKGNKTYTFTKTLTGFKKEVTELTEEEVKQQTEITVDKISETKAKDVTADKVKITKKPEKWEVTIKSVKANANTIEVTLEAKKNDKTYTFTKTLTGFKVEKGELDKDAAKFTIKDESKEKMAGEITKDDIKVEDTKEGYKSTVESVTFDDDTNTVVATIKQTFEGKPIEGSFEITLKDFPSTNKYAQLKLVDDDKKEITKDKYKDHFADDLTYSNVSVESTNPKYKYHVRLIRGNDQKGTLTVSGYVENTNGEEIGKFELTITGFKTKLPEDENDAQISIKNLAENKYDTKNAGDIKEEDIEFKSTSGKYKYKAIGLETNDATGELTINYKQLMQDDTEITKFSKTLKGFKKITSEDKTDIEEIFENLDKKDYNTVKASEAAKKTFRFISKSGKYQYQYISKTVDDSAGKITFKLKWAIKNGVFSEKEIEFEVTGFKTN